MDLDSLYPGVADHSLRFVVSAGESGVDLTTSSYAVLRVRHEDGREVDWIADVENLTTSSVDVVYSFMGDELVDGDVGTLRVYPEVTITGGAEVLGEAVLVPVDPRFAR